MQGPSELPVGLVGRDEGGDGDLGRLREEERDLEVRNEGVGQVRRRGGNPSARLRGAQRSEDCSEQGGSKIGRTSPIRRMFSSRSLGPKPRSYRAMRKVRRRQGEAQSQE